VRRKGNAYLWRNWRQSIVFISINDRSIGKKVERKIEVVCSGEQDGSVNVRTLQGGSVGDGGRPIDRERLQQEHRRGEDSILILLEVLILSK